MEETSLIKKGQEKINIFFYYLIIILFLEIVYKVKIDTSIFNIGLFYIPLFSISFAFIFSLITRMFNESINKVLVWVITILLCFIFGFQYIFVSLFSVPFSFYSLGLANQGADFISVALKAILNNILVVILMLLPIIFLIVVRKKIKYTALSNKNKLKYLLIIVAIHCITLLLLLPGKNNLYSPYKLYYNVDASTKINSNFGLLTGMRIDIKRIFIHPHEIDSLEVMNPNVRNNADTDTPVQYNVSDIDFNAIANATDDQTLKQMDNYFANEQPTNQNEYTGIFKDKNLIFIVAESFNQIAIDKDLTPTLYKLANNSFVFNNYYTPTMFSTVGGEMQALLGLLPYQETINLWAKEQPTFPYAIGNSFAEEGYTARAYHNWTYTYYDRDKTRPTIGFSNYLAKGNGLEKLMDCSTWPTSDVDLIDAVSNQFIEQDGKSVTYILTVSGHPPYTWNGSYIASKNRDLVKDLPYGEDVKAYLAGQIELDRALQDLLQKLQDAGELDNTVITLVGDHEPYYLTQDEINEVSTYPRDKAEVNHSTFILYNSQMPTTVVNKVSEQIDVLPTLLNLFGIPYDSRLIIGKDIFSDTEGLAIFSQFNWRSDLGVYNDGKFTPSEGIEIPNGYVDEMNKIIANKFLISKLLITESYYEKVIK